MRDAVLVGRDVELVALRRGLDAAAGGRGSLFLISGEPGIGKTRLADDAAREAAGRGFLVAWGRCWEAGGAPSFWPWAEALRAIDAELPLAGRGGELAPLLEGSASGSGDAEAAAFRLLDATLAALREASARRPIVLVLDDLHVADRPSLQLLHFVARGLRTARLIVLGMLRDAEARRGPNADLMARVGREAVPLPLSRLDAAACTALAVSLAGRPLAEPLVRRIFEVSEGNPLFLDESLRLLLSGDGAAAGVPEGIRDVIRGRLVHLPDAAREALAAASVLGRELDLDLVAEVTGREPAELRSALELARDAGALLAWEKGRIAFSHILVRETLYQDLPGPRRAELHARLARALERRRGDAGLQERAHHALAGVPAFPVAEAVALARRGAALAASQLAFDRAAELLQGAAAALNLAPDAERCDLDVELAVAQFRAGASAAGMETCRRALALARRSGDPLRLARAALALGTEIRAGQVDAELVAVLEEAVAALGEGDVRLRSRLLARLAGARQPAPDPAEPMELAREAIALARRIGDPANLLLTLHDGLAALFELGPPDERARLDRELAELALARGEKVLAERGFSRLVVDLVELCDLPGAERALVQLERVALELRHPRYAWRALLLRSMLLQIEGRFDEAVEPMNAAAERIDLLDDLESRLALLLHRGWHELTLERWEQAVTVGRRIEEVAGHTPMAEHSIALWNAVCLAGLGDAEGARRSLRRLDVERVGRIDPIGLCLAVRTLCTLKEVDLGRRCYAVLQPLAHRTITWGLIGMAWDGPVSERVGRLAALLGRPEEALAHLEDAVARARAMPSPPRIAQVLEALAAVHGERGDRDRARAARSEAAEIAGRIGMPALAARLGSPDPVARTGPPRDIALERDGEVWTVRSAGNTFRLKDARGLQLLATLVASPGREFHVLELSGSGPEARGDAGEVLDARAVADYKARLLELREEQEEAEGFSDPGRAERAREEIEVLTSELSRGLGLGGRSRKAGDAAERARVNVQRRLKDALRRIAEQDPELGAFLEGAVHTGVFCSYQRS